MSKKKISKKKQMEEAARQKRLKRERNILIFSSVPPFALSVAVVILYAFHIDFAWLFALTAALWFALGALFIYATRKRWGYVPEKSTTNETNVSVITVYNIVLLFALGVLFAALFFKELFF